MDYDFAKLKENIPLTACNDTEWRGAARCGAYVSSGYVVYWGGRYVSRVVWLGSGARLCDLCDFSLVIV